LADAKDFGAVALRAQGNEKELTIGSLPVQRMFTPRDVVEK
jgi:hypothetical protein